MGYFKKEIVNAIVFEYDDNKEALKELNQFVTANKDLFFKTDKMTNGYITYSMAWDGSKEWWDESDRCDELRSNFIRLLKKSNAEIYHMIKHECEEPMILTHEDGCRCMICEPEVLAQ